MGTGENDGLVGLGFISLITLSPVINVGYVGLGFISLYTNINKNKQRNKQFLLYDILACNKAWPGGSHLTEIVREEVVLLKGILGYLITLLPVMKLGRVGFGLISLRTFTPVIP